MHKQHTELNVLICCLKHVRKRAIYDDLEKVLCTPAELSLFRHYVAICEVSIIRLCYYLALKIMFLKLRLHVAIFVSRFTFKPAWNAHWCVYTRSLIVFIV